MEAEVVVVDAATIIHSFIQSINILS